MKTLLTLLFLFSILHKLHAQDTLYRINGNVVLAKIDTVRQYDIRYSLFDDPNSIKYNLSKSVIASIAFASGRRDTFFVMNGAEPAKRSPMLRLPIDTLYQLGRRDAKIYYTRYRGARTGTLLATFPGSPLLGAIVGGICSATPPKEKNLEIPNVALAHNTAYADGYLKKARSIKTTKIWLSFCFGVLANAAVYAFFLR